jgi:excisionase family DNA binding protein
MSSNIEIQRICGYCGNEFTARTTTTRYCSHKCNSRDYKAKVKANKIDKSNTETRQAIVKPIEELKSKPFLSIAETGKLLGISRRTIYRMMQRNELRAGKAGKRRIIQRTEIDKLFL